jgi:oxalate decarboxylase
MISSMTMAILASAGCTRRSNSRPWSGSLDSTEPVRQTKGGEVRVADSSNFTISKTIAVGLVTQRPGSLREMHWHPQADERAYWIKRKGQVTGFETGPKAVTLDFNPGDIGYINRNNGHYVKNVS